MHDPIKQVGAEIRGALRDWLDFSATPRKIIARRRQGGRLRMEEGLAMKEAYQMLDEGVISIITKNERDAFGRGFITTYVAERVK